MLAPSSSFANGMNDILIREMQRRLMKKYGNIPASDRDKRYSS